MYRNNWRKSDTTYMQWVVLSDGRERYEYHKNEEITILVVDFFNPLTLSLKKKDNEEQCTLYRCEINWRRERDAETFTPDGVRIGQGERIWLEIDKHLLKYNPNYQRVFFEQLLKRSRVINNLESRLMVRPLNKKCGRYMGGVRLQQSSGSFKKYFNLDIGEAAHDSPEAQQERKEYLESLKREAQRIGEGNRERMKYVQDKISGVRGEHK